MIAGIWPGYTSVAKPGSYEKRLKEIFIPEIQAQKIPRLQKIRITTKERK
jgi:hypothetical protein